MATPRGNAGTQFPDHSGVISPESLESSRFVLAVNSPRNSELWYSGCDPVPVVHDPGWPWRWNSDGERSSHDYEVTNVLLQPTDDNFLNGDA